MKSYIHLKCNYFREFYSLIELGIIICSWTGVGIYIWRYKESQRIGSLLEQTNGYVYIDLQLSAYVNDLFTYLFGFCCFFGTIKFLRLCRFNRRLNLFSETLKSAAKEILSFTMMFSIVFFAFLCLFYLLFISKMWACSSLLGTAQMLFEMATTRYNIRSFIDAEPFLGPFCFSFFMILVVFICMSMFLSIIADNFRRVRKNMSKHNDEIFSFMWNKFQRRTGWKKPNEEEIREEEDARMRTQYYDPIERFPEKIDQLLNSLNRVILFKKKKIILHFSFACFIRFIWIKDEILLHIFNSIIELILFQLLYVCHSVCL
jgi:ABC-type multidrug transport system fused ATPase/permease subunit